jgi:hypothetical protein
MGTQGAKLRRIAAISMLGNPGLDLLRTQSEQSGTDDPDSFYPFVVVRIACRFCPWSGADQLASSLRFSAPRDRLEEGAESARKPPFRHEREAGITARSTHSAEPSHTAAKARSGLSPKVSISVPNG